MKIKGQWLILAGVVVAAGLFVVVGIQPEPSDTTFHGKNRTGRDQ